VHPDDGLRPWPRIRDTWWVFVLAGAALGVFVLGFLVALRCGPRRCHGSLALRLLDLDAVGGLPRLFTTALFLAAALMAWRARRSVEGSAATWWAAVAAVSAGLALAKVVSLHSTLEEEVSPLPTLLGGVSLTVLVLGGLWTTGRRSGVGARSVVAALAAYALAALGLDQLTGLAAAVQDRVGWLTVSGATFVEELGEALAALLLVVTVRWQLPSTSGRRAGR
jgi:hypothetical protein